MLVMATGIATFASATTITALTMAMIGAIFYNTSLATWYSSEISDVDAAMMDNALEVFERLLALSLTLSGNIHNYNAAELQELLRLWEGLIQMHRAFNVVSSSLINLSDDPDWTRALVATLRYSMRTVPSVYRAYRDIERALNIPIGDSNIALAWFEA